VPGTSRRSRRRDEAGGLHIIAKALFSPRRRWSSRRPATIFNPGAHGLSEVLYNFASVANNNGSAFAGQGTGSDWYTITMGLAMLIGRFFLIIPALAIGGSLVRKQKVPVTAGTFPTDTTLFGGLVFGAIAILAGLTFFPALALGPIVEQLTH
jgi:K+-transporting ATPase ATPase A chain